MLLCLLTSAELRAVEASVLSCAYKKSPVACLELLIINIYESVLCKDYICSNRPSTIYMHCVYITAINYTIDIQRKFTCKCLVPLLL